jgi:hypothetical protein
LRERGSQLTNSETAILRSVDADSDGIYTAPNLVPRRYEISASRKGFATVVRLDVLVTVGSKELIDFKLNLAEVKTKIEVSGTTPAIQLASSTLEATENSTTVRELLLNGRDWTALAQLQVGVAGVYQYPLALSSQRANRGLGVQLSIGGTRPQGNNYRLDGISINDYSNGGPGSVLGVLLGVEAIQEFSVVTNSAPASYGRTSGGVINSITRSGTNKLHAPLMSFSATARSTPATAAARTGNLTSGTVSVDPGVEPYLALYRLPNGPVKGDTGYFTVPTPQNTNEDFFTSRLDFTMGRLIASSEPTCSTMEEQRDRIPSITTSSGPCPAVKLPFSRKRTHFGAQMDNTARLGFSRIVSQAAKSLKAINPVAEDMSLGFLPGQPVGVADS